MSKRPIAKGKISNTAKSAPTKGTNTANAEPAPWQALLPSTGLINNLKAQNRTSMTKDIINYMTNPTSHPDIISNPTAQAPQGTPGSIIHKDEFTKAPLFQSNLVTVDTDMSATRIGGRGLVALDDIQPGTLLLCEYIRHPFEQNLKSDDDGTAIRPEVEFIQQFCFDMSNQQRVELLLDLAPLFPFRFEEIETDHVEFLQFVYQDFLQECLTHITSTKRHIITFPTVAAAQIATNSKKATNLTDIVTDVTVNVTEQLLLRLICVIHFNSFPSGILLHTSMVNHNCQPNAVKLFIPRPEIVRNSKESIKTAKTTVHKSLYQPKALSQRVYSELRATTFIKKGEEIFISYIPSHLTDLTMNQRQTYLHRQFRFNCDCALCGFEKEQLELTKSKKNNDLSGDTSAVGSDNTDDTNTNAPTTSDPTTPLTDMLSALVLDETTYEFDNNSNLAMKTTWIDELTRNYINFTTGHSAETSDQQHEAYLKASQMAKDRKLTDDNDGMSPKSPKSPNNNDNQSDDDTNEDDDDGNDDALMSFREIYGLPTTVNVQVFILLQVIPILYPYLFKNQNQDGKNEIFALQNVELQQLLTKCHKLILMVCKDLLQHIGRDVSIETISLILYLYMLLQPQNSVNNNDNNIDDSSSKITSLNNDNTTDTANSVDSQKQQQQQMNQKLIPWSGQIQLSSILTEIDTELTVVTNNDNFGFELAHSSNNNNGTKYNLNIIPYNPLSPPNSPIIDDTNPLQNTQRAIIMGNNGNDSDNWTIDCFLQRLFHNISYLVLPSHIITSHPILIDITTLPQTIRDNFPLPQQYKDEQNEDGEEQPKENVKVHARIVQLLLLLKPISQLLLSQYSERIMATIHLTISTIGLISSLFNAKYHSQQYQLINSIRQSQSLSVTQIPTSTEATQSTTATAPSTTTPPQSLFAVQISTTYNDILFNILYYLQNFLPHTSFASKILRLQLLKEIIGKSPADATRFVEAIEMIHYRICDLYNACPIETIAKGV